MECLTMSEMAKKWNMSRRRVSLFCSQNRIEGAVLNENVWLIPDDAKKQEDPRRVRKIGQEKE